MRRTWMTWGAMVVVALLVMASMSCRTPAGRSASTVVDDSVITTTVKAKLVQDELLSAFAIDVDTFQQEVTLTGAVDNEQQRERAARIATSVEGVKGVNNLLKIKKP